MIQIYNSMTQEKEDFLPIEEGKVSMYVCGPTVYNYIHIGNARSTVAFDVVRRYLEYRGFEVNYVQNFTDVDDKVIDAAKEKGVSPRELADFFIDAYFEDTGALNVKRATTHPRVMDNIPEIIDFIEEIIANGYAYVTDDGSVYYDTRRFEDYGKLSKINLDDLREGASERLTDEEMAAKKDPADFILWKPVKADEISWDSPWGKGRPGWHIECSVMSTKYLGDTFDIHGGGHDLQFPHHENEIAQTEAKTGKTFSNYWMHNGFVNMDNEKMSKSLGNFVLVHDLIQEVDPQVIRFFMATAHYRQPINYTEETLQDAESNLKRIQKAHQNLDFRLQGAEESLEGDALYLQRLAEIEEDFVVKMDDDFNAANGITVVYELVKEMNRYEKEERVSQAVIQAMLDLLERLMDVFGIDLVEETGLLDAEVDALIQEREEARKSKDFARADEIRDQLLAQGIILEDTRQGVRWSRG